MVGKGAAGSAGLGAQAAPSAKQRNRVGGRSGRSLELEQYMWSWAHGNELQLRISCTVLSYVAGPGIMGGLFPKESTPISEIILFPESGQFLRRPPEASVSCPISECMCLSILYFYSALG